MRKIIYLALFSLISCQVSQARLTIDVNPSIDFLPFDELFAYEKQPEYIIDGFIDVGSYSYDVFHDYTMKERQIIFQVCKKYLPWQYTEIQEQWERTIYMYQFVIKSPPPFPYPEYQPIPIPAPSAMWLVLSGLGTLCIYNIKRRSM
jgi:hypothetical protein